MIATIDVDNDAVVVFGIVIGCLACLGGSTENTSRSAGVGHMLANGGRFKLMWNCGISAGVIWSAGACCFASSVPLSRFSISGFATVLKAGASSRTPHFPLVSMVGFRPVYTSV
jgi:hypothetical protein